MNFYGSTPVEQIFETLEGSIYAEDISVMCIDNMQFMLSDQAVGYQKFDLQDRVTSMLRQLATKYNVHIFLVVHPKKVEDDTNLNASSIFGSSKITQEADNVFILQKATENVPNYRRLQLVKNRFNGFTGETSLAFSPSSRRYFELFHQEKEPFIQSNGNIKKLVEARKEKFGCIEPPLDEVGKKPVKEQDVGHLEMFKKTRPANLKKAVQKDLEQYSERSELGNKDLHLSVVNEESAEVDQEEPQEFDRLILEQFDQLTDEVSEPAKIQEEKPDHVSPALKQEIQKLSAFKNPYCFSP